MKKESKLDMLNSMWNDIKLTIAEIMLSIMFIVAIAVGYNTASKLSLIILSMSTATFMVLSVVFFIFAFNKFTQLYKIIKEEEKENDGT